MHSTCSVIMAKLYVTVQALAFTDCEESLDIFGLGLFIEFYLLHPINSVDTCKAKSYRKQGNGQIIKQGKLRFLILWIENSSACLSHF